MIASSSTLKRKEEVSTTHVPKWQHARHNWQLIQVLKAHSRWKEYHPHQLPSSGKCTNICAINQGMTIFTFRFDHAGSWRPIERVGLKIHLHQGAKEVAFVVLLCWFFNCCFYLFLRFFEGLAWCFLEVPSIFVASFLWSSPWVFFSFLGLDLSLIFMNVAVAILCAHGFPVFPSFCILAVSLHSWTAHVASLTLVPWIFRGVPSFFDVLTSHAFRLISQSMDSP